MVLIGIKFSCTQTLSLSLTLLIVCFCVLVHYIRVLGGASTDRFHPAASNQMMLIDAGRGQEALELDEELLGYLKEERRRNVDELVENHVNTMEAAIKCVATLSCMLGRSWY